MKTIVVRQPWAWRIVHGFNDIENRSWKTRSRSPLLIEASATRQTQRNSTKSAALLANVALSYTMNSILAGPSRRTVRRLRHP